MAGHSVVVIGASAGGVEALAQLVEQLPPDLDAAVFVTVHFPSYSVSFLPDILNRFNTLPALHPQDGEKIQPGRIYIAPPDYHLRVHPDTIEINRGPKENGHRPAIDTMFRSAAQAYGPDVIGVVLTGMLDDGTSGLNDIKVEGGIALVQDPAEALFRGMPQSVIDNVAVDKVLPLAALAQEIVTLTCSTDNFSMTSEQTPRELSKQEFEQKTTQPANQPKLEDEVVAEEKAAAEHGARSNAASPLTCPDCGGVLWELRDGNLLRFRCHVGHAYSADSLIAEQSDDLERVLWTAVRSIEERAALSRRLEAHAVEQNRPKSAEQFARRAADAEQNVSLIKQIILRQQEMRLQGNSGASTSDADLKPDL
ncbi:chemotaxis protein CheB [Nodosilinea sp. LEGE 06152]|uniref:chemotaxis protein CheB n=1 Tax=Nodosilinea sp. LEGE 06152 TaxID=2777966 RepID=UPI001880F8B4|nr:chemotaxis protein CheB [Nodosilinea sp. LEGE 06152]MBE9157594.1 chemotaxis protein CheB [Nodosilinea sp. LEGE 06152]